jgi:hypothetical protein
LVVICPGERVRQLRRQQVCLRLIVGDRGLPSSRGVKDAMCHLVLRDAFAFGVLLGPRQLRLTLADPHAGAFAG